MPPGIGFPGLKTSPDSMELIVFGVQQVVRYCCLGLSRSWIAPMRHNWMGRPYIFVGRVEAATAVERGKETPCVPRGWLSNVDEVGSAMWIDNTEQLERFCDELRGVPYITVDTEFMRVKTYRPILCLVQIGHGGRGAVIDVQSPACLPNRSRNCSLILTSSKSFMRRVRTWKSLPISWAMSRHRCLIPRWRLPLWSW